ncbi:MAG: cytochrome c [Bacteriovoracia bacterium]
MTKRPSIGRKQSVWAGVWVLLPSFALTLGIGLTGCRKEAATLTPEETQAKLVSRGKAIYQTSCIACHNPDPRKGGTLGPEIAGSSEALIEARVMRAEYPQGYTPKRTTKSMVAMPQLKGEIQALTAYLNSTMP